MAETKHPVPKRRRGKRFLIGALGLLLLLVLIYPLWLPWVLKPLAAGVGVRFLDYQRHGYARIELRNVTWADASVSVSADQLHLQLPHHWLRTRLTGVVGAEAQVVVDGWRLETAPSGSPASGGLNSLAELLDGIQTVAPTLSPWLRSLALTRGEVQLAGSRYAIPVATLRDEKLTVEALESLAIVEFGSLSSSFLAVSVSNALATVELQLKKDAATWTVAGGGDWQSNRIAVEGRFDRSGWLPVSATLGSDSLTVPAVSLGLGDFAELHGSVHAAWTNAAYTFDLSLAQPSRAGVPTRLDGITFRAGGRGGFRALELTRLELAAPFLTATLDRPLTFDYAGGIEGRNATLKLWADLSRMEVVAAEGQVSGFVTVMPTIHSPLRLSFRLTGTNLFGAGLQTKTIAAAGLLDWPLVQVTNLTAEFDSGGKLVADLELEAGQAPTLSPQTSQRGPSVPGAVGGSSFEGWRLRELHWKFDGPLPVALPESVELASFRANGIASGVWPDLAHTGRVEVVDLEAGVFRAALSQVNWAGQGLALGQVAVRVESGSSTLEIRGKGGAEFADTGTRTELECDAFELVTREGAWALREPFQLELASGTNGPGIRLSPLELAGPESRLSAQGSIQWPSSGVGEVSMHGLRSSHIRDFLAPDLPELQVPEAALSFAWEDGPLVFDLHADAQWRQSSNTVWSVAGRAKADGQSLQFDSLRVDLNAAPCAELSGHLPLGIEPGQGWSIVEAGSNRVAQFDVRVVQEGPLWSLLEQSAGVKIVSPTVGFRVRGELPAVQGELVVNAARVRAVSTNTGSVFAAPDLENIRLEAGVDLSGIVLRRADAQLLGQEIRAQARWTVDARNWTEWWNAARTSDWGQIAGSLQMEDAQLSALSAVAPEIIAPVGQVDLDLAMEAGLRVSGRVRITGGATRFFKPLGALRDIETDIALDGWKATINSFAATLGGRPVGLGGELAWRADGDRQFDLRLTGQNLSLVRDPELFVRADLDLQLQKSFDEVARLSGEVQLRRSLLFRDFNSLIGFNRDQPEQRPPYFSIPQPPFGDWRLDVRVKGDRFLNVFSPAFKGEVSAGLQLLGTLREPIAVGAVTVDSGKVLFPFGTLQIASGRVDLTREDPYRPRLEFRAEGRNYGYTVTVDLRGPMDAPNLTFQSVPPLNAQQILLMLTAGEIPRSDFGYDATDKAGQVGYYIGKEFVNRFIGNTSTTERLILKSGEDVTNEGKTTYSIEYLFTDRWSVFGEYDRFQNVNSGLKFKVLSK